MSQQDFKENWKIFSDLVNQVPTVSDEKVAELIKRYVEQNIIVLNDVLSTSIDHLQKLKNAKNTKDIIYMQLNFTNEINNRLAMSAQRFLNASLGNISDYNEWLKSHCDLATD